MGGMSSGPFPSPPPTRTLTGTSRRLPKSRPLWRRRRKSRTSRLAPATEFCQRGRKQSDAFRVPLAREARGELLESFAHELRVFVEEPFWPIQWHTHRKRL